MGKQNVKPNLSNKDRIMNTKKSGMLVFSPITQQGKRILKKQKLTLEELEKAMSLFISMDSKGVS